MDFEEAKRVLAALEREGVRYVLVGSMAMAAQGIIRATRDIDFFVAPDVDNIARLRRALVILYGDDPNIEQIGWARPSVSRIWNPKRWKSREFAFASRRHVCSTG